MVKDEVVVVSCQLLGRSCMVSFEVLGGDGMVVVVRLLRKGVGRLGFELRS